LNELLAEGETRVSSVELSHRLGCTPSQVRQDLNNFGRFGLQGFGYGVDSLQNEIKAILGLDRDYAIIVAGAGDIGRALLFAQSQITPKYRYVAMFDADPVLFGTMINGVPVLPLSEMQSYARDHRVDIAALTLPKKAAREAMLLLTAVGVMGIWDFTGASLKPEGGAVVESMDLTDSLMMMSYKMNNRRELP